MYITTFLRNTDIVYSIPIIIFVIGAIPWTILGCIKLYEFITNREELEIIYDSGKYNKKTKIFNQNRECDETIFMYIFSIKNISKNKTAESIFVIIDGLDTVSHKLQYTNDSYNINLRTPIYNVDIHPGLIAYFALIVYYESEYKGKTVNITASGKNIPPTMNKIIL